MQAQNGIRGNHTNKPDDELREKPLQFNQTLTAFVECLADHSGMQEAIRILMRPEDMLGTFSHRSRHKPTPLNHDRYSA